MIIICLLILSVALVFSCYLNVSLYLDAFPGEKSVKPEDMKKLKQELEAVKTEKDNISNQSKQALLLAQKEHEKEVDILQKRLSNINEHIDAKASVEAENRTSMILKQFEQNVEKAAQVKMATWKLKEEKAIREDAIKRSQAVVTGKVTEHILPYLEGFNFNPKDCRFVGSPLDFLVFAGLSDKEEVDEIVFVEIKTGKTATLTDREKAVRDAVICKRVRWQVIHKTQ